MNQRTKRSTPELRPKAASILGIPGFLSCPATGFRNSGVENREAQPMSHCSHQLICEGVGDALRDQNMLYRKSLPGMDWDRCQDMECAGS